jgi:hypothetical protein
VIGITHTGMLVRQKQVNRIYRSQQEGLRAHQDPETPTYCLYGGSPVRLDMMWRARTGRADIANYVLDKINNYGRAIGLLR